LLSLNKKKKKKIYIYLGLTARLLTVNVGIQPFGTHFRNLLRLAAGHVVKEATQVDACVQRTQLFLIQMQHLVDTPLVLQLFAQRIKERKDEFLLIAQDKVKVDD
jgi:hypothetical protein